MRKELLLSHILPFINELAVIGGNKLKKKKQGKFQYEMAGMCKESTEMRKKPEKKIQRPMENDEAEIV
jgi:hypothetical protein